MNHNTLVIEMKSTLDKLIAARTSLGYDYIVYGLLLINEDQTRVSNITKALYIDIAAHYETSWSCVEKNIRNTVNAISADRSILQRIHGYCRDPFHGDGTVCLSVCRKILWRAGR